MEVTKVEVNPNTRSETPWIVTFRWPYWVEVKGESRKLLGLFTYYPDRREERRYHERSYATKHGILWFITGSFKRPDVTFENRLERAYREHQAKHGGGTWPPVDGI